MAARATTKTCKAEQGANFTFKDDAKSPLVLAVEARARNATWVRGLKRAALEYNGAPRRRDPVLTAAALP